MATSDTLRQIMYVSTANPGVDVDAILQQSRHNNAVDGVTGLLWVRDGRFLQVLEGPETSVAETFERIATDGRHRDVRMLHDRTVDTRQFGYWSMERGDRADEGMSARMIRRLSDAPFAVREAFLSGE